MLLATVKKIQSQLIAKNFGGVLERLPVFFSRASDVDGFHDGNSMHFNLADTKGWRAVRELVYHELVHQYVDDFLCVKDNDMHGKTFKKTYAKFLTDNFEADKAYTYDEV